MFKSLKSWGKLSPQMALFATEAVKSSRELRAARLRLLATHALIAKPGVDRKYIQAALSDWEQQLLAIEKEIFEFTMELGTTPPEPTTEA